MERSVSIKSRVEVLKNYGIKVSPEDILEHIEEEIGGENILQVFLETCLPEGALERFREEFFLLADLPCSARLKNLKEILREFTQDPDEYICYLLLLTFYIDTMMY